MAYVKGANNKSPDATIEDFPTIKEIAGKCGFQVNPVLAPHKKPTTHEPVSIAGLEFYSSHLDAKFMS